MEIDIYPDDKGKPNIHVSGKSENGETPESVAEAYLKVLEILKKK
jgi:hypothetical protein